MNKVLLIEPDKMLRHAFTLALFPEFPIHFADTWPDTAPKDFAAVIVDLAALRGPESMRARGIRAAAEWHLPIVWIDGGKPVPIQPGGRCVRLSWPVAKDEL